MDDGDQENIVQSNHENREAAHDNICALGSSVGPCSYRLRFRIQRQSHQGLDSITSVCRRSYCLALALAISTPSSPSLLTRIFRLHQTSRCDALMLMRKNRFESIVN